MMIFLSDLCVTVEGEPLYCVHSPTVGNDLVGMIVHTCSSSASLDDKPPPRSFRVTG